MKEASSSMNGQVYFTQGINFRQTRQFITPNILMATCLDSTESSSGLPKNRSDV